MVKFCERAAIAQLVERIHGKDEVSGSIPDRGSILICIEYKTVLLLFLECRATLLRLMTN